MSTNERGSGLFYHQIAQMFELPELSVLDWNGDDLWQARVIQSLIERCSPRHGWASVMQFYFPLTPGDSADSRFRICWCTLKAHLYSDGFWIAIFEPRKRQLVVHLFLGHPLAQDPGAFEGFSACLSLHGSYFTAPELRRSHLDFDPECGLAPQLKAIRGPAAVTPRTNLTVLWVHSCIFCEAGYLEP